MKKHRELRRDSMSDDLKHFLIKAGVLLVLLLLCTEIALSSNSEFVDVTMAIFSIPLAVAFVYTVVCTSKAVTQEIFELSWRTEGKIVISVAVILGVVYTGSVVLKVSLLVGAVYAAYMFWKGLKE